MATSSQGPSATEQSPFKLPRSSYNELVKIVMAYGKVNKPAPLDEISQYCGVGRIAVSSNNAFLSAVGVIEGGKAKIATQKGLQLARALEHQLADEIVQAWRQIVYQNSFLDKMVTAVKIRRGFETSAFESHIAYSSGEPRSQATMTGARTVIDILRSAMVIKEQDGKLQVVDRILAASPTPDESTTGGSTSEGLMAALSPSNRGAGGSSSVAVVLQLRLEVTVADLEGLGMKLRKMIAEFDGVDSGSGSEVASSTESPQLTNDSGD
jgi:hypothetical protein